MDTYKVKVNWIEQRGKLKQKFAILTNNDSMLLEGKKEEILGRLQTELGKTKEELEKIIAKL